MINQSGVTAGLVPLWRPHPSLKCGRQELRAVVCDVASPADDLEVGQPMRGPPSSVSVSMVDNELPGGTAPLAPMVSADKRGGSGSPPLRRAVLGAGHRQSAPPS